MKIEPMPDYMFTPDRLVDPMIMQNGDYHPECPFIPFTMIDRPLLGVPASAHFSKKYRWMTDDRLEESVLHHDCKRNGVVMTRFIVRIGDE